MNNKLINSQIAELLSASTNKPVAAIEQFLAEFSSIVNGGITNDQIVKIRGIGTFKVTMVKERVSVHVITGERIIIPPHHKISFLPENKLKELINKPFAAYETMEIQEDENGIKRITMNEEQDSEIQQIPNSTQQESEEDDDITTSTIDENTPLFLPTPLPAPPPVPIQVTEPQSLTVPEYEEEQPPPPPLLPPPLPPTPPPTVTIEEQPASSSSNVSHHSRSHSHSHSRKKKKTKQSSMKALWIILFILIFILIAGAVWYFFFFTRTWDDYASKLGSRIKDGEETVIIADSTDTKQSISVADTMINTQTDQTDSTQVAAADSLLSGDSVSNATTTGQSTPFGQSTTSQSAQSGQSTTPAQERPIASSQQQTTSQQTATTRQEQSKPPSTSTQSQTSGQNQSQKTGQESPNTSSRQTSTTRQTTTQPSTSTSQQRSTPSTTSNKVLARIKMQPGDRLTLLAEKYYGLKVFWVYIYEYNKVTIGSDPNRIRTNMEILIPAKEVYGIDATSNASIDKATEIQRRLVTGGN
jgi:nucleoid DNA-binding protein/flagellar basal body-associated protein FliL